MESQRFFLMKCIFATVFYIFYVVVAMGLKGYYILFNGEMIIEILSGRRYCDISNNGQEFEGFRMPSRCKYDSHFPDASANSEIIEQTLFDRLNCGMLKNLVGKSEARVRISFHHPPDDYDEYDVDKLLENKFYNHNYVYDLKSDVTPFEFSFPATCPINASNCGKFKATNDDNTKISDNNISSIKITGSDFLKQTQLPLPCTLWKNIRRQSKWYLERPTNVSILVKVNNISVYRCIFRNDHFYECAITSKLSLIEYTSMSCMQEDGTMQKVFKLNNNNKFKCKNTSHVVLYMFISYCVFTVIIGVCTCRKSRLSYAIVHKLKSFSRKGYQRQVYTFDAFISYSHSDIDWVLKFYKTLQSLGHKMSFDEKDVLIGAFISDNIYKALGQSRKVIFIITEHFLKSIWGEFELEVARTYALENGRHNMIIVVLKDDVSFNRMPNALKDIWYKTTCIKWITSEYKQDDDNSKHETKCFRKVHKAISVDFEISYVADMKKADIIIIIIKKDLVVRSVYYRKSSIDNCNDIRL